MSLWLAYALGCLTLPVGALALAIARDVVDAVRQHRRGYEKGLGTSVAYHCPDCNGYIYSKPWPFMPRWVARVAVRQAKRDHLLYWTSPDPQPPNDLDPHDEADLAGWLDYRNRMRALHQDGPR